jgi:hypothetical protein
MATLQMKIDRVHTEFLAGNAVSSTVTTHSVVARDGSGNVHANKFKSANMELTHNVPTSARTSDTVFYSSFDDVIRKNTAAGMRGSLGLDNVNNTGATVAATADKIVLRDSEGGIFATGVTIADNPGTLFSYSDGTRSVYGGCDSNDPWFGTSSNHDLRLVTYSDERMRIDNTGNVGIGVTDPDQKLEVRGNIKASYSDTNHGMFLDAGGTLRRDYGGAGAGFHFTNTAIWPTDYLGDYSAGGINFGDSSYRWNNVYTEELNASGEVITGTVNATSYKLTGDTTPHKQSIKNSANLSVGWYRIAENGNAVDAASNGSRCSARFTIIDYDSSLHSTRTLYAGGTYGNKPFIHLLTNTSYSGDGIISKVRVVEGSTYEGLAVEIYVDTACSTNEIRIVMDDNYQGNGFTMVDFESVVADHSNMNEYELDLNTTFWGMFLDNTTKNICMLEDGNVGIGTASPAYKLDVSGTGRFTGTVTAPTFSGNAATATNADKVDNLHASSFLRSDTSDTCTGTLYVSGGSYNLANDVGLRVWRAHYQWYGFEFGDDEDLSYYVSIWGHHGVRSSQFVATSDERVKTDIQTLDPEIALLKLEKIRPVSYKMKETGQFMFGFIGQEIEKELPNVVNKSDGILIDFNIMGEFSNKQSIKYQFEHEEKDVFMYTLTLEEPIPSTFDVDKVVAISASSATGNTSSFLYDPEYCGKPEIGGTVMKLLHETELIEEGRYKIIGTETNDFRSLDYNEIFTVTTAALKEVNEQLKAEKIKMATLETKYEELLKRVEDIEAL